MAHPAPLNRIEAQHERIMRGRNVEALEQWPTADQINAVRAIATVWTGSFGDAAYDILDRCDEIERELREDDRRLHGASAGDRLGWRIVA